MEELIIRITDLNNDVEVLKHDHLLDKTLEKKISFDALFKELAAIVTNRDTRLKPKTLPVGCIGYNSSGANEVYVINQPEHKRYVTLSTGGVSKAYKINYPNSIFIVSVLAGSISTITQYMYVDWKGMETELYYPAMPNTTHSMCIGQARKTIENGDVLAALESIIYSPYSHSTVDNIKSFKNSTDYFEYLTEHSISAEYLKKYNQKLKDIYGG